MTTVNELPTRDENPDHAIYRDRGYNVKGETMIGRLRAAEFDRLDAIIVNGGTCQVYVIAKTLDAEVESIERKLYDLRVDGLVETVNVDLRNTRGGHATVVRAFRLTRIAHRLFREALDLMDRGEAAA